MARVQEKIVIGVPAAQVFARLAEPERTPEWMQNLQDVQRAPGAQPGVGLEITLLARAAGKQTAGTGRYTVWNPNDRLAFETTLENGVTSQTTFDLSPDGQSTRLTATVEYELPPQGVGGFAVNLLAGSLVRRELRQALANLKRQLEDETAGPRVGGTIA